MEVEEFEDGTVVLQPRVLVSPNALTADTLKKAETERDVEEFDTHEGRHDCTAGGNLWDPAGMAG